VTDRERDFRDAQRAIDESMAMSMVNTIVRWATLSGSPNRPALKGSAYGAAAIAGCTTHALLLQLMPAAISPVKPMAYGMVVAFVAFVAVAGFHTTRSSKTAIADNSAGTANTRNN